MDESLNFTLPPASLSQMCTAKIATTMVHSALWNTNTNSFNCPNIEKPTKNLILANVQGLKLPEKFVPYLRRYLLFVRREIRSWWNTFEVICNLNLASDAELTKKVLGNISWTCRGQIDPEGTARNCSTIGDLSVETRYRLACTFHLECSIRQLWTKMIRESSDEKHIFLQGIVQRENNFEVVYWSYEMSEGIEENLKYMERKCLQILSRKMVHPDEGLDTFNNYFNERNIPPRQRVYLYALTYSLLTRNACSIRFFGRKLDPSRKAAIFKLTGSCVGFDWFTMSLNTNAGFSFLSTMNRTELERIFQADSENVIHFFRVLPSELFVRIFRDLIPFLGEKGFLQVLLAIAYHDAVPEDDDSKSPLDPNCNEIFYDIWVSQVPESYRTYVANQTGDVDEGLGKLLKWLCQSNQWDNVYLLLRGMPEDRRRALIEDLFRDIELDIELDVEIECPVFFEFSHFCAVVPHLVNSINDLEYLKDLTYSQLLDKPEWKRLILSLENSLSTIPPNLSSDAIFVPSRVSRKF